MDRNTIKQDKYSRYKECVCTLKTFYTTPDKKTRIQQVLSSAAEILNRGSRTLDTLLSNGNIKIGTDTLIFNITSAYNCPSDKLGLCAYSKVCYAKKAERQYWFSVRNYREEQEYYWAHTSALTFASELVKILKKKTGVKFIRFSEAGDVRHQEDIRSLITITMYLNTVMEKNAPQIYLYTKRIDLDWSGVMALPGITVNGSDFMLDNDFTIVKSLQGLPENSICKGDCRICNMCKYTQHKTINILKH